jgi:hypothetical protein
MKKLEEIRCYYYINQDIIREDYPRCIKHGYPIEEMKDLTPIEYRVFETIQFYNLPLLPQFPVGKYFVDFGDPVKKIAIEVDGEKFHLDKRKDEKRQKEIENEGWMFFRIKGKYTYYPVFEYYKYIVGEEMESAENDEVMDFVSKHKGFNSDCLIIFLNHTIYKKNLDSKHYSSNIKDNLDTFKTVERRMELRVKRRLEWEEKHGKIKD